MRRLRNFLLLLITIGGIRGLALAQTPDAKPGVTSDGKPDVKPDEKRLSIAKDVMDEFARGSLDSVRDRFTAELKSSVTEGDMKDAHDQLVEICGPFQSQISQTARMSQGAPVYIAKSQFARYKVELRLAFDDANAISDFRIGPISDMSPEAMEAAARAIADELGQRQFADVNAKFNSRMKEAMPTERLEASWTHVMMHLGLFKSIKSARKDPDADQVDVRCEFDNGPMIVRVAFDPAGKISGLWMLPAEPEKDSQI